MYSSSTLEVTRECTVKAEPAEKKKLFQDGYVVDHFRMLHKLRRLFK